MHLLSLRWSLLLTTGLVTLSACTTLPNQSEPASSPRWYSDSARFKSQLDKTRALTGWHYSAKVAVVTPRVKEQANMVWQYADQSNNVRLFGPLGAGAVRLEFDQYGVVLSDNKGVLHRGASAEELLTRIVGWPIPIDALSYWLFALPNPDVAFRYQLDDQGQLSVLRQQGWTIQYSSYRNYETASVLPRRLTARKALTNGEMVEVKLVTKGWQW